MEESYILTQSLILLLYVHHLWGVEFMKSLHSLTFNKSLKYVYLPAK